MCAHPAPHRGHPCDFVTTFACFIPAGGAAFCGTRASGFSCLVWDSQEAEGDDTVDKGSRFLPPLAVGDALALEGVEQVERSTKPPPRYTDAGLIKARLAVPSLLSRPQHRSMLVAQ